MNADKTVTTETVSELRVKNKKVDENQSTGAGMAPPILPPKPTGLKLPSKIAKSNLTQSALSKSQQSLASSECTVSTTATKDSVGVLTEDTDSFIIGQRVWVNGQKPGTIAYIGETQFAPGEWAGIVLDEPLGKNDGSVAGIRYFQCENKKGVFSRLTRLSRYQLDSVACSEASSSPSRRRSLISSPLGSSKGLASLNQGISSPLSSPQPLIQQAHHPTIVDFKIGDRVIIKSGQGSKVGNVRYIGVTDFAPGEWVGVELDEPRGKNDGTVSGRQYFVCKPNYGVFALVSKVSKSPAQFRPSGNCVVHGSTTPTSGLPPSGLTRAYSKESMSSIPSGMHREQLQEKQKQIDQLLKERDLDRQEMKKAASLAETSEKKLQQLQLEHAQLQGRLAAYEDETPLLHAQINELRTTVEDERSKREEWEFRYQEASIIGSETAALNKEQEEKIFNMQAIFDKLRQRSKDALDDVTLNNNESLLQNVDLSTVQISLDNNSNEVNKEIEMLRNELKKHSEERAAFFEKHEANESLIANLTEQLNVLVESAKEHNSQIRLKEESINALSADIKRLNEKLLDSTNQVSSSDPCESVLNSKQNFESEIGVYRDEIANLGIQLDNKSLELIEQQATLTDLNKLIEELKAELEVKNQLLETKDGLKNRDDSINERDALIDELNDNLMSLRFEIADKSRQLEHKDNELKGLGETVIELRTILKQKEDNIKEQDLRIDEAVNMQLQLATLDTQCKNYEEDILKKDATISSLRNDLKKSAVEMEQLEQKLTESQDQVMKLTKTIESLHKDLEGKDKIIDELRLFEEQSQSERRLIQNLKNQMNTLKDELEQKDKEIEINLDSITSLSQSINHLNIDIQEKDNLIKELQIKLSTNDHAPISELEKLKEELNDKITSLKAMETSISQVQTQFEEVKAKELNLNTVISALQSEKKILEANLLEKSNMIEEYKLQSEEHVTKIDELERRLAPSPKQSNADISTIIPPSSNGFAAGEPQPNTQIEIDHFVQLLKAKETKISELSTVITDKTNTILALSKILEELRATTGKSIVTTNGDEEINDKRANDNPFKDPSPDKPQDMEEALSQIKFLNSIILDIQLKNTEQKDYIALLEERHAIGGAGSVEQSSGGIKLPTPRKYCDICEEFDKHDTEDCPQQQSNDYQGTTNPFVPGTERLYCYCCEVFGHTPENCPDPTF